MMLKTLQLSDPYGTVAYREQGQGAPIVLIHGVGMQSAAWGPQIKGLSKRHRVIALDMPGHGGSSPLPPQSDLPAFVAWLHAVLEGLALKGVSLAGHSMGALLSAGYAATHPGKLARVALLNGVFRRDPAARDAVIERADVIAQGEFDLQTPLARWFGESKVEQTARTSVAAWLSEVDRASYATAYRAFARGDATYADDFGRIDCPLLAITGDGDPNSTAKMTKQMANAAPMGRSVVIKGHKHMVNLTAPELVTETLLDWMELEVAGAQA
ncbi:alpha/beta hydrolase [Phaeobacter sp.]|uniref:alpha/beta fold hydrolase n=1 Tax=Phaeobacter sp. TaxID=1902409 RepID=UPI0025F945A6|nr:alpha/beta hydrolase [Phaeobacter sp.]